MQYKYDVTTSKYTRGTNTKKFIVLHHTGGVASLSAMTNYLAKHSAQVSAHYLVDKNGDISRIGTDDYILWHAGTGAKIPGYVNNMNAHSIGIEVISNGTDFTEAQIEALEDLVKEIQKRHEIKTENIIRHKDYSTRKWDIGDNFFKVVGSKSFDDWKATRIDEKPIGDYRRLAGDSIFRDTETAGNTLINGTPDERIAILDLNSRRNCEDLLKKHGLIK